jgi:hypothetical protein
MRTRASVMNLGRWFIFSSCTLTLVFPTEIVARLSHVFEAPTTASRNGNDPLSEKNEEEGESTKTAEQCLRARRHRDSMSFHMCHGARQILPGSQLTIHLSGLPQTTATDRFPRISARLRC